MARRQALVALVLLVGCAPAERPPGAEAPASSQPMASAAAAPPRGKLVDLTHPFDEQTIYWPTENGFVLERGNNGRTEKGYYYAANRFQAAEHGGTHVDAPIHFFDQRNTVDKIELARLAGDAVVIDVVEKCAANRDYEICVADLRQWEEDHGRQLVDVIVLLRTGWARRWPDRGRDLGEGARGG